MMIFRTINLKRGIKHVFLVLDAALRLGDAPFIVLGTDCTGSIEYLLRSFGDGVLAKLLRENPMVQARVTVPCLFPSRPLYACGPFLPYISLELPVTLYSPSFRYMSSAAHFFRFGSHEPYARFLDNCNT